MTTIVNFDGSCAPINPGGMMGMGFVVVHHDNRPDWEASWKEARHPSNTCNVAEMKALIGSLRYLASIGCKEAIVRGDSKLCISYMTGVWRCKKEHLMPLVEEARRLSKGIKISWQWVPREQNARADALT